MQVKGLIDTLAYRKGKIEAAVLLHSRCTDQANFAHALRSLDKESDRSVRAITQPEPEPEPEPASCGTSIPRRMGVASCPGLGAGDGELPHPSTLNQPCLPFFSDLQA